MTFDLKKHLIDLTELHAPSGYETAVRDYLRPVWEDWTDELRVNKMGSLIGIKRGNTSSNSEAPRKKIMLAAHMDEIGMMVGEIRDGYVRLEDIYGTDDRTLQGKSVIVHGRRPLVGTVAAVPPHISASTGDGRRTYPRLYNQWVDLGLPAEEVAEIVRVGDVVTMDSKTISLRGGYLAGKAMDDRASIAAVSHCLKLLQRRLHDWDVYAVATTQEEVNGYAGATTSAYEIEPDLAIAIDVTFAKQPGVSGESAIALGKGFTLGIGPNFHPQFRRRLEKTARENEIPFVLDPLPGSTGTDAWAIQVTRAGVPTALLSLPLRNMHTTAETISLKDVRRVGRLMAEVITNLDGETLDNLAWQIPDDEDEDEYKRDQS